MGGRNGKLIIVVWIFLMSKTKRPHAFKAKGLFGLNYKLLII
jgi:hypothetical protein